MYLPSSIPLGSGTVTFVRPVPLSSRPQRWPAAPSFHVEQSGPGPARLSELLPPSPAPKINHFFNNISEMEVTFKPFYSNIQATYYHRYREPV